MDAIRLTNVVKKYGHTVAVENLSSLHACVADGIDVRGFTYWSLLDNFEWAMGYAPKFSLVEVDRVTFQRSPKAAYHWLADVIAENGIPSALQTS